MQVQQPRARPVDTAADARLGQLEAEAQRLEADADAMRGKFLTLQLEEYNRSEASCEARAQERRGGGGGGRGGGRG